MCPMRPPPELKIPPPLLTIGRGSAPTTRQVGRPLDIINDDASHRGEYSRKSFEVLWPFLTPEGGVYMIEDMHMQPEMHAYIARLIERLADPGDALGAELQEVRQYHNIVAAFKRPGSSRRAATGASAPSAGAYHALFGRYKKEPVTVLLLRTKGGGHRDAWRDFLSPITTHVHLVDAGPAADGPDALATYRAHVARAVANMSRSFDVVIDAASGPTGLHRPHFEAVWALLNPRGGVYVFEGPGPPEFHSYLAQVVGYMHGPYRNGPCGSASLGRHFCEQAWRLRHFSDVTAVMKWPTSQPDSTVTYGKPNRAFAVEDFYKKPKNFKKLSAMEAQRLAENLGWVKVCRRSGGGQCSVAKPKKK